MSAEAVKKRRHTSEQITKLLGAAKRIERPSEEQLNSSLETLETVFKQYLQAQEEVLDFTGQAAYDFEESHSAPVTEAYKTTKQLLLAALEHISEEKRHAELTDNDCNQPPSNDNININMEEQMQRLQAQVMQLQQMLIANQAQQLDQPSTRPLVPRITIPKFGGDISEWTQFHDLFMSLIGRNGRLSGSEKMHHLKNSLVGEAELLLRPFAISDANYAEAWDMLKARYENKRLIIAKHLDNLLDIAVIHKQDHKLLRKLVDIANESVRSLRVLEEPVDHWNTMLVHVLAKKLDTESRRQWELEIAKLNNQKPTFLNLIEFLETLCRAFESSSNSTAPKSVLSSRRMGTTQANHASATSVSSCIMCKETHSLRQCSSFRNMTIPMRRELVAEKQLCFNCLNENHRSTNCSSVFSCRHCKQKHHTMLHLESTTNATTIPPTNVTERTVDSAETTVATLCSNSIRNNHHIMLATAVALVQTAQGEQPVRILIDPGSESSFVTENVVQRFRLKKKKAQVSVTGIGGASFGTISGITEFVMKATTSEFIMPIEALVLTKITSDLPRSEVTVGNWPHLNGIILADPDYHRSSPIDVLLGADYYHKIIGGGIRKGSPGTPIAQETMLGWILSGTVSRTPHSSRTISLHVHTDELLKKFWEIEEVAEKTQLTQEEVQCEEHFTSTHFRSSSGRYTVELPFKVSSPALGDSRNAAANRLIQMERRFKLNDDLKIAYCEFMEEYENLGHMTEVQSKVPDDHCYYLPHHAVTKESSTTKVRVVFDASRPSKSGYSLNDKLMVGPKLQEDLFMILLRFRKHRIALTADIAKMYRQVDVAITHRDFQRILWRKSPTDPVKEYQLNTVTYGTSAAPYLAVRTLQQLAVDEKDESSASATVLTDFYVDDLITGCDSEDNAIEMQKKISSLLRRGGFDIRKWTSSSQKVLRSIPIDHQELRSDKEFSCDSIKTLGLHWKPSDDIIFFKINTISSSGTATKRTVLSEIARLFDPIGLLAPVIVTGKIMLQQLWLRKLDWDDTLPLDLQKDWHRYCADLQAVNTIQINRWLHTTASTSNQLHGFADASERAYAAVVYVRSTNSDGQVSVDLITAKTKVAPTKQLSVPRLELCAALLLSKLLTTVKRSLHFENADTYAWSDSTITLAWIKGEPSGWKTFVANRVAKIQNHLNPENWNHIVSSSNPADCASRGLSPAELKTMSLWWQGPAWLTLSMSEWPISCSKFSTTLEEKPVARCFISASYESDDLLLKYSSWNKLKRVTAYCCRFAFNSKHPSAQRKGFLTTHELEGAAIIWIKKAQNQAFSLEITSCTTGRHISSKSKIQSLSPFLHKDGLLRVGGRIHHSPLPYHQRHQIILPHTHTVTELILRDIHLSNLHAGNQLMLAQLRCKYWIPNARSIIRQVVHRCIICFRFRAKPELQSMGNLPAVRVTPCNAFQKSGVDYAGPINLRLAYLRGPPKLYKAYIAVFVCMSSRAMHLEAVSDMTSETFIKAFARFTSRRGPCTDLYSDNGTTFKGADKELQVMHNQLRNQMRIENIAQSLLSSGTNWHFIPPAAPHFGGLWEAGVKSVKHHLRRVMGLSSLTFDDFQTLLCQIEACLNSRPLCPMSDDPTDFNVLTPAMLISGTVAHSIPEPDLSHIQTNRLSRFQQIQSKKQDFWKVWRAEYLVRLQQRSKWRNETTNIAPNQLVLLLDNNVPPTKWKIGRIAEVHPGLDGLVRVVTISQGPETALRKLPITKICALPLANDESIV